MSIYERIIHTVYGWFNPAWDKCRKASCWSGSNAAIRLMNILSPHMDDGVFRSRVGWMKARGCDTAHLFVSNNKDGQYAGYCPYGTAWTWKIDNKLCKLMRERMRYLRRNGFAVVVWLFADDDGGWNREAAKSFPGYLSDCKESGLLTLASQVVIGLELNEYYTYTQVGELAAATRAVYKGKIATHETSSRCAFAGMADVVYYQLNPGVSAAQVASATRAVKASTGKPVNMFEVSRSENRALADAALNSGACGVGNW